MLKLKFWLSNLLILLFASSLQAQNAEELKSKLSTASKAEKVKLLNQLSELVINTSPEEALGYAEHALEISTALKDEKGQATALLNKGTCQYYLDEYKGGISTIEKGLAIFRKINDREMEGISMNRIGEIYVYIASYDNALKYLSKARAILEDLNIEKELARCSNNLGIIHKNQYNLEESLKYFKKGFELGDDIRKGDASMYMGQVYVEQKKFTDADKQFQQAIQFAEKNEDNYVKADALIGLGQVNAAFGKIDDAEKHLAEALKLKEEVEDQQGVAIVCNTMGNLYLQKNKPEEAHVLFEKAVTIAAEIKTREELKDAYLGLSNTFHLLNKDDKAYEFLDKYNKLNEELLSEQASKKLEQIEASLAEAKRKQKEEAEKAQEKLKRDQEKFMNRVYIGIGIGVIVILLIFFYILYNRYKLKQKANEEITRQKEAVERQKEEVEAQKHIIEEKNKEITDSINYAQKIQMAVLPKEDEFNNYFNDSFILFKPKDIVSGDFYWFTQMGSKMIYVTADCTGHGVPGGFMSMLGTSLLNEVINERKISDPAQILNTLRERVIQGLKQTGASGENKDGMDLVLTIVDKQTKKLQYAAANNGFYILRNNELIEYKADKQPIGIYGDTLKPFTAHNIELQEGDCIYTFTDGYADQFGGPKGKKFKYKQLEEIILKYHQIPMRDQKSLFDRTIEEWRSDLEQNDDICLIGVRI